MFDDFWGKVASAEQFKVAVIGGGLSGLAAAIALSARGMEVVLVEKDNFDGFRVGENLTASGRKVLLDLGVPEDVLKGSMIQIKEMDHLLDGSAFSTAYRSGYKLKRPHFDRALAGFARRRGVRILTKAEFQGIYREPDGWLLEIGGADESKAIRAEFVVDAAGRTAPVARAIGQERLIYDKLIGMIGYLTPKENWNLTTDSEMEMIATPNGWWYFAKQDDGRIVAAWMTDCDLFKSGESRPGDRWRVELEQTKPDLFSQYNLPKNVMIRSICSQRLDRAAGPGWLAVGDAAVGFDPLTSAGINKGLADGLKAASVIEAYFEKGCNALKTYDTEAKRMFTEYLQARANYYRREDRWRESLFWQRRKRALPWESPITLDPRSGLRAGPHELSNADKSFFERYFPCLQPELLVDLARPVGVTRELVDGYQSRTGHRNTDHEIISALQILLEKKVMTRAAI